VVGAGAAGTVAYIKGDLETTEPADIDTIYAAAKKTLDDLEVTLVEDSKDALTAEIVARDAENRKITIKLNSVTEQATKLSIRVGAFGDETASRRIYNGIRDNLI
jgi:pyruvate/2-oxoglutarate/acetoin dehydrogenase E1 component